MWQLKRIRATLNSGSPLILLVPIVVTALFLTVLWEVGVLRGMLSERTEPDLVVLVLAVMAIVFASIQFLDARRHATKMEEIAHSMSTRYVGGFPKDMDDIVEVAGSADREMLAMADFADYGHYSKPDSYDRFLERIHAALARKVNVKFLVYGDDASAEALRKRFPLERFSGERSSDRFKHFFSTHYEGIREPSTHAEFLGVLHRKTREAMSELFDRGAKIRLLDEQEKFFFWMEDDEEVIFSFENGTALDRPLCFRTRDARLIETFKGIFDHNWASAQEWSKTFKMPQPLARQQVIRDPGGTSPPQMQVIPPHSFPPSTPDS